MKNNFYKIDDPQNKYYKYALDKEMNQNTGGHRKLEFYPPYLEWHPLLNRYRNNLILGTESTNPTEYYKIFKQYINAVNEAFTVGTGSGFHQKEIEKLGIIKKWLSLDLVLADGDMVSTDINNEFIEGDLNFIELEENKFELIFCAGVLHHIINLEHLLFQFNKALKPNGVLVVIEATTKNKWQWEKERLQFIEKQFRNKFNNKYKEIRFQNVPLWFINNYKTPFESIRAEELSQLIDHYFITIYKKHWNRFIYPFLNTIKIKQDSFYDKLVMDSELMNFIIELEENLSEKHKNLFSPSELIGVYKKKPDIENPAVTEAWNNKTIKEKLGKKAEPLKLQLKNKINDIIK